MRVSRPKPQLLTLNLDNGKGRAPVKLQGEELQRVHRFKYLGSSIDARGGTPTEITKAVRASMDELEEIQWRDV